MTMYFSYSKTAAFVGLSLLGATQRGLAALATYSDQATFLAATGAASASGPLPNLGLVTSSYTVGTVTFSLGPAATDLYIGAAGSGVPGGDWTSYLPGHDIAISGLEDLNMAFPAPVYSAGFQFAEPSTPAGSFVPNPIDSTFAVTLKSGVTTVGAFNFNAQDDVPAFVGVWSSLAFDAIEVREIVGNNDDEFYGEVFTGSTVPEPRTTAALAGLGLLGFGAWRRLQRRRP